MAQVEEYDVPQRIATVVEHLVSFQLGVKQLVDSPCLQKIVTDLFSFIFG